MLVLPGVWPGPKCVITSLVGWITIAQIMFHGMGTERKTVHMNDKHPAVHFFQLYQAFDHSWSTNSGTTNEWPVNSGEYVKDSWPFWWSLNQSCSELLCFQQEKRNLIWLVVWNIFIFRYFGNKVNILLICFRWVETTNQSYSSCNKWYYVQNMGNMTRIFTPKTTGMG
jgi:hypothetical protein